jgi:hypothetical protein
MARESLQELPALPSNGPMVRRILPVTLVLLAVCCGCTEQAPSRPAHETPSEPSFAAQAAAVRAGESTQIRLDHSVVTDADLNQLTGLEDKLRRINLSRTEITSEGMKRLGTMHQLEQLRLASVRVDDAGLAPLADLKQLRFLHLLDMPITGAGIDHLHGLTALESLYLDGTKVSDEALARLLAALPGVHLHIDDHHHRLDPHAADHAH